ncbi:porin [Amaricoccus macauensis]|uniref:porin n=1 Tax=Amaricoccus macauensis TaxID=57001 RepID=UPI003C7A2A25
MLRRSPAWLALAGTAALGAPLPAAANPLSYSNDTGGSVLLYGQVDPAYVSFDDGEETYGNLTDNSHSNTRVGMFVDQSYANGGALRFNFETALGAPSSSRFSQDFEPDWEWDKTRIRKVEVNYGHTWGTIWLGQGNMASESASSSNLSGTTKASSRATPDTAGGYFLRESGGALSDVQISDAFAKWDGTRRLRVRYDTPRFLGSAPDKGVSFRIAYGVDVLNADNDSNYTDVGIFHEDTYGDFRVKASGGYGWTETDGDTEESWSASASTLYMPVGISGTVAGGELPAGGNFYYANLGWQREFFSVGTTALSVDHYWGDDTASSGADARKWGLQFVQYFDELNMEAYLAYDNYSFSDDSETSYQDASATMAGIYWKF